MVKFINYEILKTMGSKGKRFISIPCKTDITSAFWIIYRNEFYIEMFHSRNLGTSETPKLAATKLATVTISSPSKRILGRIELLQRYAQF